MNKNGGVWQKLRVVQTGPLDTAIEKAGELKTRMGRLAHTVLTPAEFEVYNRVVIRGSSFSEIANSTRMNRRLIVKLWEAGRKKVEKAWVESNIKAGR